MEKALFSKVFSQLTYCVAKCLVNNAWALQETNFAIVEAVWVECQENPKRTGRCIYKTVMKIRNIYCKTNIQNVS